MIVNLRAQSIYIVASLLCPQSNPQQADFVAETTYDFFSQGIVQFITPAASLALNLSNALEARYLSSRMT